MKHAYDAAGRETKTEKGHTTSAIGADFVAFGTVTTTYDAAGQKVKVVTPAGITQIAYDALNRATCTAVRMNPAAYGNLPADACTQGPAGADGPDRIVEDVYDDAGQKTQTRRAVGTPLVRTYVTYTHMPNGQQATILGARSNLSTMEHDGFDRLGKLRFPVPTVNANASSTTDYEAYGYDPAGNQISVRKRDGRVLAHVYDALNRQILKDSPTNGRRRGRGRRTGLMTA